MSEPLPMTTDKLRQLFEAIDTMAPPAGDSERIDRVRLFEELKSRIDAVQAEHAVEFAASQRAEQAAAGVPAQRRDRGIAAQLGLARRISPWAAARWLGFARIATAELPGTFAELRAGRTSQWRAMLVARETAVLSREDRAAVDAELAPRLEGLGDRQVETLARTAAHRLDAAAAVKRARRAETERRVSIRPAPDTMCWLSALLPVAQGVAAYAALTRTADTVIGTGEDCDRSGGPRSRGQVMADALVQRLTGQATAQDAPVEITLIMTDRTLLDEDDEPAVILGYGPIPAGMARDLAYGPDTANPDTAERGAAEPTGAARAARGPSRPAADRRTSDNRSAPRWLRRLYTHPDTGQLVTMDTRRRLFTRSQRYFLRLRDQTCRSPYCGAPVRHADHVKPAVDGGRTAIDNGEAYCAACNFSKQAPGWHTRLHGDLVFIGTPTGHTYTSRAPDPPGGRPRSPLEIQVETWLHAA